MDTITITTQLSVLNTASSSSHNFPASNGPRSIRGQKNNKVKEINQEEQEKRQKVLDYLLDLFNNFFNFPSISNEPLISSLKNMVMIKNEVVILNQDEFYCNFFFPKIVECFKNKFDLNTPVISDEDCLFQNNITDFKKAIIFSPKLSPNFLTPKNYEKQFKEFTSEKNKIIQTAALKATLYHTVWGIGILPRFSNKIASDVIGKNQPEIWKNAFESKDYFSYPFYRYFISQVGSARSMTYGYRQIISDLETNDLKKELSTRVEEIFKSNIHSALSNYSELKTTETDYVRQFDKVIKVMDEIEKGFDSIFDNSLNVSPESSHWIERNYTRRPFSALSLFTLLLLTEGYFQEFNSLCFDRGKFDKGKFQKKFANENNILCSFDGEGLSILVEKIKNADETNILISQNLTNEGLFQSQPSASPLFYKSQPYIVKENDSFDFREKTCANSTKSVWTNWPQFKVLSGVFFATCQSPLNEFNRYCAVITTALAEDLSIFMVGNVRKSFPFIARTLVRRLTIITNSNDLTNTSFLELPEVPYPKSGIDINRSIANLIQENFVKMLSTSFPNQQALFLNFYYPMEKPEHTSFPDSRLLCNNGQESKISSWGTTSGTFLKYPLFKGNNYMDLLDFWACLFDSKNKSNGIEKLKTYLKERLSNKVRFGKCDEILISDESFFWFYLSLIKDKLSLLSEHPPVTVPFDQVSGNAFFNDSSKELEFGQKYKK